MPRRIVMLFQIRVINLSRNAADGLVASPGKPKFGLRTIEIRIFTWIEMITALRKQRRNPMYILPIDRPGNAQKRVTVISRFHRADRKRRGGRF